MSLAFNTDNKYKRGKKQEYRVRFLTRNHTSRKNRVRSGIHVSALIILKQEAYA